MTTSKALDLKPLKTKCPLCKNKGVRAFRPFCSKRCKDIDLGNWMLGAYAIPDEDTDAKESEGENPTDSIDSTLSL